MRKTREERKMERSLKASRAAQARWNQYHASLASLPLPDYSDHRPEDMYRVTVENLMTSESHVLVFHPGQRVDSYAIDVDGKPWRSCGWSQAIDLLRKSCVRLARRDA